VTIGGQARVVTLLLGAVMAVVLATAPAAPAHAPLSAGSNESLATATQVDDPTKSWAVYADLHEGGEAQYYRFQAARGDSIPLQVLRSPAEDESGFVPGLAIMGPGVVDEGTPPAFLQRPAGAGVRVVPGDPSPDVSYEPFSPSAMREIAGSTLAVPQDGTYYVAVYGNDRGGRYGLAIGSRESFTPAEWLTVPLFFATIYSWEGQPLWRVYLPAGIVVVAGLVLLALRRRRSADGLGLAGWVASLAGLLFIASGTTVAVQMILALVRSGLDPGLVATVFLAGLPVALGAGLLVVAERRSGHWSLGARVLLAVLGLAGLLVWGGWMVGPALAVLAAVLPPWRHERAGAAVESTA
jgi:hypothetical protein